VKNGLIVVSSDAGIQRELPESRRGGMAAMMMGYRGMMGQMMGGIQSKQTPSTGGGMSMGGPGAMMGGMMGGGQSNEASSTGGGMGGKGMAGYGSTMGGMMGGSQSKEATTVGAGMGGGMMGGSGRTMAEMMSGAQSRVAHSTGAGKGGSKERKARKAGSGHVAKPQEGFVPLLNGKDLSGWKDALNNGSEWKVVDGVLEGRGGGEGNPAVLVTQRQNYANFRLRAKFHYLQDGWGWIELRRASVGETRNGYMVHHGVWPTTDRWQIPIGSITKMNNYAYGHGIGWAKQAEPAPAAVEAWNTLDITAVKNRITTSVNGRVVGEYTDPSGWYGSGEIALAIRGVSAAHFQEVMIEELQGDGEQGNTKGPGTVQPADHLQPGSTWEGSWTFEDPGFAGREQPYRFVVTERSGDRFKAESVFSSNIRAKVEGTIRGDRIEYEDTGEKPHHFSMTGTLQANQIKFRFQGTGGQGNARFGKGAVILQEK